MKRTLATLIIGIAFAVSVFAAGGQDKNAAKQAEAKPADQKSTAGMPTVDQIIEKYVQALGGKAAIEKITSRVMKGTFELPAMGLSTPIETYAKAPDKNVLILDVPGYGLVREGFNGTVAWSQEPTSGLREKSGEELVQSKLGADIHSDLKFKSMFPKMELLGKEKVGDREAYVIQGMPEGTGPVKLFFDTQTGLLIKRESEAVNPMGKMLVTSIMEDYREVDGVKMPFTLRNESAAMSFTIKVTEVKHNVAIDDAKFNKPSN